MRKLKNIALIIGTMKGGTTSLYGYLSQHPDISSSNHKETMFFSSDERFGRGPEWYYSLYDIRNNHRIILDGSTDCSKYPYCGDVPRRLDLFRADAKLIYIMRHPIRRMESHARHVARSRTEVNEVRTDRLNHSLEFGPSDASRSISNYAMQIDQFREWFDRGDLLLITSEQLIIERDETLRKTFEFLGLKPISNILSPKYENRGDNFTRPRYISMVKYIPILGHFLRTALPRSIRAMGWTKDVIPGRFYFTKDEEEKLIHEMRTDLDRLRDQYGVDINRWWGL
jgi:hypothetical protein